MQPIIRRTITITINETWTITWPDGQKTNWQETYEVAWPADREPAEWLPSITADEARDDEPLDPDVAAATEDG